VPMPPLSCEFARNVAHCVPMPPLSCEFARNVAHCVPMSPLSCEFARNVAHCVPMPPLSCEFARNVAHCVPMPHANVSCETSASRLFRQRLINRCIHKIDVRKTCMGWLRLVGSFKLQISFAEYRLFYRAFLQKKPIILRSLLIVATPYQIRCAYMFCVHRFCAYVD